jgi:hypothetical protein
MSRSKTFSGRDDDNLCLLLPRGVVVSQERKTGTSDVTESDGSRSLKHAAQ